MYVGLEIYKFPWLRGGDGKMTRWQKARERLGISGQGCVCIFPRVRTKRPADCRRNWTGTPHIRSSFPRIRPFVRWQRKVETRWLRTRANTTHERRGYVDRLRKGTSLLLLSGHSGVRKKSWTMDHACSYSLGQIWFFVGDGEGFTVSPLV